jgi:two-component system OmpR family sensor kinase/two-component system sensor histidine kinase BaeS
MNQMWVRISITYIVIVIFLFLIPSVVYFTLQGDEIGLGAESVPDFNPGQPGLERENLLNRLANYPRMAVVQSLLRIFFSISMVGILVGVISSRGLAAPLRNLAIAARAVGKKDLSQRIDVKGSSEIREVAVAFNAMAEALENADIQRNHMLADIAHELRTPLTVIQGNLRAILDDVYDLDKIEVARLYDQTRQLSRLVDDLHDLSQLEANQFSLTLSSQNLADVINDVAAIYQPVADDQGIQLTLEIQEGVSPVMGDCSRITQCLNNLLNNALQYTPYGGEIQIALEEGSGSAIIAVSDNGAGIDPEHLPFVFDRFYRADPDRNRQTGGSGLGLAITQALVQAHGGDIEVSSAGRDRGSTFKISIPIQEFPSF